MPIEVLHGRDGELRRFQQRMTEVGRIRLGRFVTEGRGRPAKLDTFRFTSAHEGLIRALAELYGGEAREWKPQGGGPKQWEVLSETSAVPVYVPRQNIDPWYEAWRPGTCIRRCNGVFEKIKGVDCPCHNGEVPDSDLCKPTIRVQVLLAEAPGIGTWRFESHGENACAELSTPAPFIAQAPMPVPAMLYLRPESRRVWNAEKGKFDTNTFYVPSLRIDAITSQDLAIGGDALSRMLAAAGGVAALAAPEAQRALPAGEPVPDTTPEAQAPAQATTEPPAAPVNVEIGGEERTRILAAIENAGSLAALDKIRDALKSRNIRDKAVQDAWVSKRNAIGAALEVGGSAPGPQPVTAGNAEHQRSLREAVRGGSRVENMPEQEYAVGDTVTVGGIEFTKHSDEPFGPGVLNPEELNPHASATDVVEAQLVEPDDTVYDVNEQYMLITSLANGLGWTTVQVNDYIKKTAGVESVAKATGAQLKGVLSAMQLGLAQGRGTP
jgi:hypothetical protein